MLSFVSFIHRSMCLQMPSWYLRRLWTSESRTSTTLENLCRNFPAWKTLRYQQAKNRDFGDSMISRIESTMLQEHLYEKEAIKLLIICSDKLMKIFTIICKIWTSSRILVYCNGFEFSSAENLRRRRRLRSGTISSPTLITSSSSIRRTLNSSWSLLMLKHVSNLRFISRMSTCWV